MKIHSIICMSCSGHMNAVNLLGISWWCVSARFVSCAVWQLNISLTWFNRARMKYVYLFFNFLCSVCIYSFSEMLLHFKVLLLICICCLLLCHFDKVVSFSTQLSSWNDQMSQLHAMYIRHFSDSFSFVGFPADIDACRIYNLLCCVLAESPCTVFPKVLHHSEIHHYCRRQ